MATCASCNQVVLFGGIREGAHRFCNAKCREAGRSILAAYDLPNFVVDPRVAEIFKGTCPKCGIMLVAAAPVIIRTTVAARGRKEIALAHHAARPFRAGSPRSSETA